MTQRRRRWGICRLQLTKLLVIFKFKNYIEEWFNIVKCLLLYAWKIKYSIFHMYRAMPSPIDPPLSFFGATQPIARLIAAGCSDWELSRRICFWWPYLIKLVTAVHHPLVAYDAARRGPGAWSPQAIVGSIGPGAWSPQAPAHWVHWSRLITSPPPHRSIKDVLAHIFLCNKFLFQ